MIIQPEENKKQINKELYESILKYKELVGGRLNMNTIKYLPTGDDTLNSLLNGGYKKGLLTEINGISDSGKTLLALKAIKETQKEDKIGIYINTMESINISMLKDNDINKDELIIINMNKADLLGPLLTDIIKSLINYIGVIVIDNLAGLSTSKEQKSSITTNTDIHRSKVIKALLMRIANLIRNTDIVAIIINELRYDINTDTNVATSERWINMCCDTRIKLSLNEDNDIIIDNITFKERKLNK